MAKEEEIKIVHGRGTHVVILGAGASYASTLKTPEKNGKKLPLMRNIVGLNNVVNNLPKEYQLLREDFEKRFHKHISLVFLNSRVHSLLLSFNKQTTQNVISALARILSAGLYRINLGSAYFILSSNKSK